ncbi:hypothetical protein [Massilia sp. TWP1-3-3]|uniref:hypothetical protein n=1 Tax=Massilia sp. TWP1-3-3 TaxID=2804573 RepID=UPI003CEB147D
MLEKSGVTPELMLGNHFQDLSAANLGKAEWEAHLAQLQRHESRGRRINSAPS